MVYINRSLFNGINEIDNKIAQKIYTEAINDININQIKCCQKHGGDVVIHGYYKRRFRLKGTIANINILRIKCVHCGKTHSVFFNDIVPYSMFNTYECYKILLNQIDDEFSYEVINKIKRIKLLILAKIKLLGLSIIDNIELLLITSIHQFYGHFLQIHRGRVVSFLLESG